MDVGEARPCRDSRHYRWCFLCCHPLIFLRPLQLLSLLHASGASETMATCNSQVLMVSPTVHAVLLRVQSLDVPEEAMDHALDAAS